MPTPDDKEFETYLKKFQPIVPDALPEGVVRQQTWLRGLLVQMVAFGLAAMVILGIVALHVIDHRAGQKRTDPVLVQAVVPAQPLTMREANARLAAARTYKDAVDSMAFHHQGVTIPKDKQSALAVLAKEKIKL